MKFNKLKLFLILFILGFSNIPFSTQFKNFLLKTNKSENKSSVFAFNKNYLTKSENFLQEKITIKNNLNLKNKITEKSQSNNKQSIMQGWLKFLEMNESTNDVPRNFKKNQVYYLQMSENPTLSTMAKDNIGFVNIPNDQYHMFELDSLYINIYTGRHGKYRNFIDKLKISDITPLISVNPCKGGIEDVGNFAEGYCFLVKFIKFSKHYIWELCSDSIFEKNNWIQYLANVINKFTPISVIAPSPIIHIPTASTVFYPPPLPVPAPHPFFMHPGPFAPVPAPGFSPSPFPNAYPVGPNPVPFGVPPVIPGPFTGQLPAGFALAQDWSPCNKPCDTGIQTRILDCVELNICMGKKFEERLCNVQRCKEDVDSSLTNLKRVSEGQWELLGSWTKCSKVCGGGIRTINRRCLSGNCIGDPILTEDCNATVCQNLYGSDPNKMEISVFQREVYDECKLLEGNLTLMINNQRVLSHVEVNTQTIQIIRQDDPTHPILMPMAKLMDIQPSNKAPGCLNMVDMNMKDIILCPDAMKAIPAEIWIQRIRDFKTICAKRMLNKIETDISMSINSMKDPTATMRNLDNVQTQILDDQRLKSSLKKRALEDQFEEFKRQTKDILGKEDIYETKLENQEKERIDYEQKKMQQDVTREADSARKLLNDMKIMAETDADYKIREISIKREMKNMMKEVEDKINEKRSNFVNKMQRMKTIHELTQKKAALELMDVKKSVGKQLTNLAQKGDPNQCLVKNTIMQNEYCTRRYSDSFDLQIECKKPKQFCYMCCDREISALEKVNVACCYKKCDDLDSGECRTFNEIYNIHSSQVAFMP